MDFNFLAAANGITSKYLNQESSLHLVKGTGGLEDSAKKQFGEQFSDAYDSMMATRAVNATMRQSYSAAHQNDFKVAADRLGYSIDNRVIDMLHLQLSDEMNEKVNSAINNAMIS